MSVEVKLVVALPDPEAVTSSPDTAASESLVARGEVPHHQAHHGDQPRAEQHHVPHQDDLQQVLRVVTQSLTYFSPFLPSVVSTVAARSAEQHDRERQPGTLRAHTGREECPDTACPPYRDGLKIENALTSRWSG